jgi:HlyD family secretion protein
MKLKILSKFSFFVPYEYRFQIFIWLFFNSILIILNILSYALLIPFFTGIINYDNLQSVTFLKNFQNYLFLDNNSFLFYIGLCSLFSIVLTNILMLYNERLKFNLIKKLSVTISKIYIENYTNSDYRYILKKKKSNIFARLLIDLEALVTNIFYNTFDLISRSILIFFIIFALFFVNFLITFFSIIIFIIIIALSYIYLKNILKSTGSKLVKLNELRTKRLFDISDNIVLFQIFYLTKIFIKKFLIETENYFIVLTKSEVLKKFPRAIMEVIFFSITIITVLILLSTQDFLLIVKKNDYLIIIATFSIAAYKLMPSVQQIFYLITELRNNFPKLSAIYFEIKKLNSNKKKTIIGSSVQKITNQLVLNNVSLKINKKSVVEGLSLNIDPTKKYCIVGPSGAGKSSLLFLISGIIKPDRGSVTYNSKHIYNISRVDKILSIAPEPASFIEGLSIYNNITLFNNSSKKNFNKIISKLRIRNLLKRNILNKNLSSGEIKRISIARALISQSKYKLLDEPTSNLDRGNKERVKNLLINYFKKETGLIYVSHDKDLIKLADFIIRIPHKE